MSSLNGLALSVALHLLALGLLCFGPLFVAAALPQTKSAVKLRFSSPEKENEAEHKRAKKSILNPRKVDARRRMAGDDGVQSPPVITVADTNFADIFSVAPRFQAVLLSGEAMGSSGLFVVEIAHPGRWPMLGSRGIGKPMGYGFPLTFYFELRDAAQRRLAEKGYGTELRGFTFGFDQAEKSGFVIYEVF